MCRCVQDRRVARIATFVVHMVLGMGGFCIGLCTSFSVCSLIILIFGMLQCVLGRVFGWSGKTCKMSIVVDQDGFCIGFCISFAMLSWLCRLFDLLQCILGRVFGWPAKKCKVSLVVDQGCFCIGFCIDFATGLFGCGDSAISLLDWLHSLFARFLRHNENRMCCIGFTLPCLLKYTCKQSNNRHRSKSDFLNNGRTIAKICLLL